MSVLGFKCKHHVDYRPITNTKAVGASYGVAECFVWDTGQRNNGKNGCYSDICGNGQSYGQESCCPDQRPPTPSCQPMKDNCAPPPKCPCANRTACNEELRPYDFGTGCGGSGRPRVNYNAWMYEDDCQDQAPVQPPPPTCQEQPAYPEKKTFQPCIPNDMDALNSAYGKARNIYYKGTDCGYDSNIEKQIRDYIACCQLDGGIKNSPNDNCLKHQRQQQLNTHIRRCTTSCCQSEIQPKCSKIVCCQKPSRSRCCPSPRPQCPSKANSRCFISQPQQQKCSRPSSARNTTCVQPCAIYPACPPKKERRSCGGRILYGEAMCKRPVSCFTFL